MPEANIFETTKLILKAKVSRGIVRNKQAIWTIKDGADGTEKQFPVTVGRFGTEVVCEFETQEVPEGKENFLITYELEADGRRFRGDFPYRVWPKFIELKALGKDGNAFPDFPFVVKQNGVALSTNANSPQTGADGLRQVDLKFTSPPIVEAVSPFVIDKWSPGKDKGRRLEAHVSRKPFTAAIYSPVEKDAKQYVNLDNVPGTDAGSRLHVKVGAKGDEGKASDRLGIKGDEIFINVVFSDKNSKRNDPLPRLIVDGNDVAPEADGLTFKSKLKLGDGGNPAEFEVELGFAGGDTCEIKVGVTDACADDKIKITTWRKLAMEIIQPKPEVISSYTVFRNDKSKGLADEHIAAIAKELGQGKCYIEMDTTKAVTYDESDMTGRAPYVVFPGNYFRRDAGKKMVCLAPQHFEDLQRYKGSNPQPKRSLVTVWADYYSSQMTLPLSRILESRKTTVDLDPGIGVFKFDPIKADGTLGITSLTWNAIAYQNDDGSWASITDAGDPGGAKRDPQSVPIDWNELQHYIEFVDFQKIKIRLPKRPGKEATDPGYFLTVGGKKIQIAVNLIFEGAAFNNNAAGWHGFIWMSTYGGKFQTGGLISTLLHELGHNLGQAYANKAIDATYGRTDANLIPGIPVPAGVPEGIVYGGKGHTGTHCAAGVGRNNRANRSYAAPYEVSVSIQNQATCIMFGAGDMNGAKMLEFCEQCRTYIKGTNADDITKVWDK